jgi:hypothetical protein
MVVQFQLQLVDKMESGLVKELSNYSPQKTSRGDHIQKTSLI